MNPGVTFKDKVYGILRKHSDGQIQPSPSQPTVLIATMDPIIRVGLTELLQAFSVNTIWSQGVEAAKRMLDRERVAACLCGFWMQDGTYRELIRHIRRGRMEIPVIIASAPACPDEYGQYLAAVNLGALDFLCFPYRKRDLERMLRLALEPLNQSIRQQSSVIRQDVQVGEAA